MITKQSILITGACGGLGRAAALEFAKSGWLVYAADVKESGERNDNIVPIVIDVTDEACVEAAAEKVGSLGMILHLAGVYTMDSFIEIPPSALEKMLEVNLMGVYRVNRAFFPKIRESGGGIIIVASELAPLDPLPFNGIYSMTKRALDGYAHSLALELDLLGIRVTTVYPGAYGDGMTQAAVRAMERMSKVSKLYPEIAERFRGIVLKEIGSKKPPEALAKRLVRLAGRRRRPFRVFMNNSLKLRLFSALPMGAQAIMLKALLKTED